MAKEKTNNAPVVLTPDNVVEEARKGNMLTKSLKDKLDAEIQEQKDAEIIRQSKARITEIGYRVNMGLVNLKKLRKTADMGLYNTRQQGRLQRLLTGFEVTEQVVNEFAKTKDDVLELERLDNEKKPTGVIIKMMKEDGKTREDKTFKIGETVPAVIDYNEFDNGLEKLAENLRKMQNEIEKSYVADTDIIKKAAGEYWRDDWRWSIRVVSNSGVGRGNNI